MKKEKRINGKLTLNLYISHSDFWAATLGNKFILSKIQRTVQDSTALAELTGNQDLHLDHSQDLQPSNVVGSFH